MGVKLITVLDETDIKLIRAIAKGLTVVQSAKEAKIGFRGAENRLDRLRTKYNAKNTIELVVRVMMQSHPAYNTILKMQQEWQHFINMTPTGLYRNKLCDLNIEALTIISNYEL